MSVEPSILMKSRASFGRFLPVLTAESMQARSSLRRMLSGR
jgi:hypothetical protein